ncbi:MAG: protein-(glutamine-N5) methyltransferase, release factor-specific [Planctomycetaceae bacterium]|nr:protein-(glutamine-N5) methyltransferase, release factor-specific [Planctomycetaceae bacterium]
MSDSEVWTIGRLLQWTTDYLKERSAASPRLDAEILLAAARNCERIELYTAFDEEPAESIRTKFRELVRRRAAGEPVAYLVGHREFYSLNFRVTHDVLIPRPETEFVVVALLDAVKELFPDTRPIRISDIGTGSGILAICAAKNIPNSEVVAVDISPAALEVAKSNAQSHRVADKIQFSQSDLLENVAQDSFHFVVSNPPYISAAEMKELPADVGEYEPHTALYGGETGFEIIAKLIPMASERLLVPGALIMEISPMIEDAVRELLIKDGGFAEPQTIKDLSGEARVVVARRVAA